MGRTSSRLAAHKRPTNHRVESEGEHSEDNEDEWTYPESRKGGAGPRVSKKMRKDKFILANPPSRKTSTKPVKGCQKYHNYYKWIMLLNICTLLACMSVPLFHCLFVSAITLIFFVYF